MINAVLVFSGGLLVIVVCIVIVLLALRYTEDPKASGSAVFETRRLYFAAVVLTGLGIIFLEAMAMYYWGSQSAGAEEVGKNIFDACKTIIPPIVTLVLGFYFGKSDNQRASAPPDDKTDQPKEGPKVPTNQGRSPGKGHAHDGDVPTNPRA